jgi:hypothetical protein
MRLCLFSYDVPHPTPFFSCVFEPGLALSSFPRQFLDANDRYLDFMSAMTHQEFNDILT